MGFFGFTLCSQAYIDSILHYKEKAYLGLNVSKASSGLGIVAGVDIIKNLRIATAYDFKASSFSSRGFSLNLNYKFQ